MDLQENPTAMHSERDITNSLEGYYKSWLIFAATSAKLTQAEKTRLKVSRAEARTRKDPGGCWIITISLIRQFSDSGLISGHEGASVTFSPRI